MSDAIEEGDLVELVDTGRGYKEGTVGRVVEIKDMVAEVKIGGARVYVSVKKLRGRGGGGEVAGLKAENVVLKREVRILKAGRKKLEEDVAAERLVRVKLEDIVERLHARVGELAAGRSCFPGFSKYDVISEKDDMPGMIGVLAGSDNIVVAFPDCETISFYKTSPDEDDLIYLSETDVLFTNLNGAAFHGLAAFVCTDRGAFKISLSDMEKPHVGHKIPGFDCQTSSIAFSADQMMYVAVHGVEEGSVLLSGTYSDGSFIETSKVHHACDQIYAYKDHLYATSSSTSGRTGSLLIFSLSNPYAPRLVTSTKTSASALQGLCISGTTAYLAAWGDGVARVDITDPANPVPLSPIIIPNSIVRDVFVHGKRAYIARETDEGDTGILTIMERE